jgi:hypothetical protein
MGVLYAKVNGSWEPVVAGTTGEYLPLAGGTLTGPLVLPGVNPVNTNEATRKAYVDGQVTPVSTLANRLAADSGPLTWTAPNPWTGGLEYRRVGAWVFVQVNATRGTSTGPGDLTWGPLPTGFRPVTFITYGQFWVPANANTGKFEVRGSGDVIIRNITMGAAGGNVTGSVAYPIPLP